MAYAVVTGASGGIGRELAALLAADGYNLVLTARSRDKLEAIRERLTARYGVDVAVITLDLSESDAAAALHEATTRRGYDVRILVNNAGFADWNGFLDADWRRQRELLQVNMAALAELAYRYGRDMRQAGCGRILNIASVAASMAGPYMATYFASKAFVRSFSEALSYELRATGVTVTAVCPGPTSTGFASAAHMSGRNFFTMTKPASARQLARFAYRRMMSGKVLAYHGPLAWAGAAAERLVPRAVTRRVAAVMSGGNPHR